MDMARTKNTARVSIPTQNTLQGTQQPPNTEQSDDSTPERRQTHMQDESSGGSKRAKTTNRRLHPRDLQESDDDEQEEHYNWEGQIIPTLRATTGGKTLLPGIGALPGRTMSSLQRSMDKQSKSRGQ